MSTLELEPATRPAAPGQDPDRLRLEQLGELVPVGRPGGQGRVVRPALLPSAAPLVVKLYRRPASTAAVRGLIAMIQWGRSLDPEQRTRLHRISAWPLAIVTNGAKPVGIAMRDVSARFEVPFVMPSGRRERVLLSLEHLLGSDHYLQLRGLGVQLDTAARVQVAERISGALAFLHRHAIVASDIAPNNLLVRFAGRDPEVCFIDCDSMVLRGRHALPSFETADWQLPPEFSEPPRTRAADAYKLGLLVLRLLARSHDARDLGPHARHVPRELRGLLIRALGADPANRPPAGEWQRALRELLARGGINQRYPGPAPAAPSVRTPQAPRYRHPEPAPMWPPAAVTARPTRRPGLSPSFPRSQRRPQPFAFAWLLVAVVVCLLVLARLLAAAAPVSGDGGLGSGSSGGAGSSQQYYYPPGSGFGP
jgi:hypothetical protein